MDNNILDLRSVKIPTGTLIMPDGKELTVTAPSVESLIDLVTILQDWKQKADDKKNHTTDETLKLVSDFIKRINLFIPELKGYSFPIDTLIKIVQFVIALATPATRKELERRGVSLSEPDGKKKSHGYLKR